MSTDPVKKEYSVEELEAMLKEKRDAEKQEYAKKREAYENNRNNMVERLVSVAQALHDDMSMFKQRTIMELEDFRKEAEAYGEIRSHSKGGFTLRNSDGSMKVMYERNVVSEYDERADMAEELLKDFLGDMVKKRDAAAYEVITGLLQRGSKGEFNPAAISALLKMEDKFDDDRWTKAIKLFKESYNSRLVAMNVSFYIKNDMEKDEAIKLTFSSIPVESAKETNV
jgi:hypothetical protein